MGNSPTYRRYIGEPDVTPEPNEAPTFDPMLGFPNGRKPRVMIATKEEMLATRIHPEFRDYCAHLYLKLEECRADNFPFISRCAHQRHGYEQCVFEDYVLRMKEYERERRLRKLQKEQNAAAA